MHNIFITVGKTSKKVDKKCYTMPSLMCAIYHYVAKMELFKSFVAAELDTYISYIVNVIGRWML